MAEIVRAGIISVDEGQSDAARSLGMTRLQTMRRIVLPQAMRVIIPPTGNETISMLKTSSLVSVIAVADLLYGAQIIYSVNFKTIQLLIVASIWYLVCTSVLYVGQYYLERHYARGASARRRPHAAAARAPRTAVAPPPGTVTWSRRALQWSRPRGCTSASVVTRCSRESTSRYGRARCCACSGPRARASRRSCAASTTSRRSTPGGCRSTASSSAIGGG